MLSCLSPRACHRGPVTADLSPLACHCRSVIADLTPPGVDAGPPSSGCWRAPVQAWQGAPDVGSCPERARTGTPKPGLERWQARPDLCLPTRLAWGPAPARVPRAPFRRCKLDDLEGLLALLDHHVGVVGVVRQLQPQVLVTAEGAD